MGQAWFRKGDVILDARHFQAEQGCVHSPAYVGCSSNSFYSVWVLWTNALLKDLHWGLAYVISLFCCRTFQIFCVPAPPGLPFTPYPTSSSRKENQETYLVIQSVKTQQVKDYEGNFCSNVCLCVYILNNVCFIGGACSIRKERLKTIFWVSLKMI